MRSRCAAKRAILAMTLGVACAAVPAVSRADGGSTPAVQPTAAISIVPGSEGIGVTVTRALVPGVLNLNLGYTAYTFNRTFSTSDVNYNGTFQLGGAPLTISWFPWKGGVNLQVGAFFNNNQLSAVANPTFQGTFTINGHTYTVQQAGTISGQTNFKTTATYLGIGIGNPVGNGRGHLLLNFGAVYQGSPNVTVVATGAAANPQLAADIQAEQANVNSKLNNLKWFPALSLGYAFPL
jgi:hypothetical protein